MGFMTIPRYPGKYPFRFGVLVVYVRGPVIPNLRWRWMSRVFFTTIWENMFFGTFSRHLKQAKPSCSILSRYIQSSTPWVGIYYFPGGYNLKTVFLNSNWFYNNNDIIELLDLHGLNLNTRTLDHWATRSQGILLEEVRSLILEVKASTQCLGGWTGGVKWW